MDANPTLRQRRGNRLPAGLGGMLHVHGEDYACEAHDLSRSGALLTGEIPALPPDERVDLTLKAPTGGLEFSTAASVVRCAAGSEGRPAQVALEFAELGAGQNDVLQALIARLLERPAPASLAGLRRGAPTSEVRRVLEAIPLGHRIALAGRATPHDRDFLVQDANAAVLDALSRNSQLQAAEAHLIAASPHVLPSTLEQILADARWSSDEEIRRLVAIHPRTPLALAERAIVKFGPAALAKVLRAPALNPALREKVLKRIAHRR